MTRAAALAITIDAGRQRRIVCLFAALVVALLAAAPAEAAYPGANGRIAFVNSASQIVTMNPDGSGQQVLAAGSAPRWSPDGTKIAFSGFVTTQCGGQTWTTQTVRVMNADGSGVRTVVDPNRPSCGAGGGGQPTWSPDGTQLAYVGACGGICRISSTAVNGRPTVVLADPNGTFDRLPAWSPDGRRILFTRLTPSTFDAIWIVNADGTSAHQVTVGPEFSLSDFDSQEPENREPTWSPDGSRFTFSSERDNNVSIFCDGNTATECNSEVYTAAPDDTNIARLTFTPPTGPNDLANAFVKDEDPAWSPDGRRIVFATHAAGQTQAAIAPAHIGTMDADGANLVDTGVVGRMPDWQPLPGPAPAAPPAAPPAPAPKLSYLRVLSGNDIGPVAPDQSAVVALDAPPRGADAFVALSSSNPAVVEVPPTAEIPANKPWEDFDFRVHVVNVDTDVQLSATYGGVTRTQTLHIRAARAGTPDPSVPVHLIGLFWQQPSVIGGATATGTLKLTGPAPAGGMTVTLASRRPSVVSVPASVTVPAGATSTSFTATTQPVQVRSEVAVRPNNSPGSPLEVTIGTAPPPPPGGGGGGTPPPSTDTVAITRAEYDGAKRELRVEATSTSATATLRAFTDSTGALIGTLQNAGGGSFRGLFAGVANPGVVRVTSSLGGTATATVTLKSATVRPGVVTPTAASVPRRPGARPSGSRNGESSPSSTGARSGGAAGRIAAPRILWLRMSRTHLVAFSLSRAARVVFRITRVSRRAPRRGPRTLRVTAGTHVLSLARLLRGHAALTPGAYRLTLTAIDAAGHRSPPRTVRFTLARPLP